MTLYVIEIPKIQLFGHHGCYNQEKKDGQQFEIAIRITYLSSYDKTNECYDDLEGHLNYTDIGVIVSDIFHAKRYNLLEALSNDIASYIANKYDIKSVNVKIKKFNPDGMNVPYVEVGSQIIKDE